MTEIAQWKKMFRTSLFGVGTTDVESFASYVARVSYWNGVTPARLLETIRLSVGGQYNGTAIASRRSGLEVRFLLGVSPESRVWLNIFSEMMEADLSPSTLHGFSDSIEHSSIPRRNVFSWCPECLGEMNEQGVPIHFKMAWGLSDLQFCPVHRTPLLEECDHCGASQLLDGKLDFRSGLCWGCAVPLYVRKLELSMDSITASWRNDAFDLLRFIADSAETVAGDFPKDGLARSLVQIYESLALHDIANSNERWGKLADGITSIHGMARIMYSSRKPALVTVRRLCFKLGTSIYALLMGEVKNTSDILNTDIFCKIPPGYLTPKSKRVRNHRLVLRRVSNYRRSCRQPPTLKSVCAYANVSTGYLRYRHPVLTKEIVECYIRYREDQRAKMIRQANFHARKYFRDRVFEGECPSRKGAYRCLRRELGIAKFPLKRAIQSAWESYIMPDRPVSLPTTDNHGEPHA